MCGRFTLFSPGDVLAAMFGLSAAPFPGASYNIAPSQPVAAVRAAAAGEGRELALLRWGLIPSWAKDPSIGNRMINARAETVDGKPAFRSAVRKRRCLIPADGFYEWKRTNGRKQPFYVRRDDGRPFAFAGIWDRWEGEGGPPVESCAILTTDANDLLAPIHDRMPVIVPPADFGAWLDPGVREVGPLRRIMRPWPPGDLAAHPVRPLVNNPGFDDPRCIEPSPG